MIRLFRVLMAPEAAGGVADVLASGYVGQGPRVAEFERAFAAAVGVGPVLALNSCTSALDLAMHLCGVGPGTSVVTTPMTCTATNSPVVTRGARPIWADVDPETGLIDPGDALQKVDSDTVAVVAVDWAGRSCDYGALRACSVPLIQDAAHLGPVALRAPRGDYVAWSMQAIKFLTTGDGGMLLVAPEEYERAKLLRWFGLNRDSSESFRCSQDVVEAGYKHHMNDIAAAIGLANLEAARGAVEQQRANAAYYQRQLAGLPGVLLPPPDDGASWWLYCVLVGERDGFVRHMARWGVEVSPVHRRNDTLTAFREAAGRPYDLPGVDIFAASEVAIPVGWWLSPAEKQTVVQAVLDWADQSEAVA